MHQKKKKYHRETCISSGERFRRALTNTCVAHSVTISLLEHVSINMVYI
jgi:hypothetical protein